MAICFIKIEMAGCLEFPDANIVQEFENDILKS